MLLRQFINSSKKGQISFCPFFSSGPCKKHPFFSNNLIKRALTSRSHRSKDVVDKLKYAFSFTKILLKKLQTE